jgi:CBS domain-containing protein
VLAVTGFCELSVVGGDGRFLGVVSERDLLGTLMPDLDRTPDSGQTLRRCIESFVESGAGYAEQPISRLVIRTSITLLPDDELLNAATVMFDREIHRLPVVADERLLGTVSRSDICCALLWPDHNRSSEG